MKKTVHIGSGMRSALAMLLAAGLFSPQTVQNPVSGQTIQQQMIKDNAYRYSDRLRVPRGVLKSNGKIGGAFIVHNQRQKRKRWRQCPQRRMKCSRRAA